MRTVISYWVEEANMKHAIVNLQVVISLINASVLFIFYYCPMAVFALCISGLEA